MGTPAPQKLSDMPDLTVSASSLSDIFFNLEKEDSSDEAIDKAAVEFCNMLGVSNEMSAMFAEDFKSRI